MCAVLWILVVVFVQIVWLLIHLTISAGNSSIEACWFTMFLNYQLTFLVLLFPRWRGGTDCLWAVTWLQDDQCVWLPRVHQLHHGLPRTPGLHLHRHGTPGGDAGDPDAGPSGGDTARSTPQRSVPLRPYCTDMWHEVETCVICDITNTVMIDKGILWNNLKWVWSIPIWVGIIWWETWR